MTYEELKRRFRIVPTSLIDLPLDLSGTPATKPVTGDCQDYARTAKKALGLKWHQAIMIRCWSPQNWKPPFLPRHAVLWVFGRGFIDSTYREFRRTPLPCIPIWPVGSPLILAATHAIGVWQGWWNVVPGWILSLAL